MQVIQPLQFEEDAECPYLPGLTKRYQSFLAGSLSAGEVSRLLAEGWRKFGLYYFRPGCPGCRRCIPLRVPAAEFLPSPSQRRLLRKNANLRVDFGPLRPTERIYEIYRDHSMARFGQETDREEFLLSFYLPSCPSLQTEIRLGEKLIGIGFLDRGEDCLSSVYFAFDPAFTGLRLGTYGALQEIAETRRLGLTYYYLGYYVPGCPRMVYKDSFRPREHFDWKRRQWVRVGV